LTNLLLHTTNTVLLFLLLRRLTSAQWRSALVAALFALHPFRVETVAWVCERKDVLSTLFGLLALWTYARHAQKRSIVNYSLALLFFTLGLMSKPMIVTLPFVMLLLDYWPLQRISTGSRLSTLRGLILEKMPFLALSAIFCVVTLFAQRRVRVGTVPTGLSLIERMASAVVSYAWYLGKTFWPVDLANPYPHPGQQPHMMVVIAFGLVVGLSAAAVWLGRRRPYVFVGWFWFFGTLIPVIGLVQSGQQPMADRFTYVPLIGAFMVMVWCAGDVLARWRVSRTGGMVIIFATVLILVACAFQTREQLSFWQNSETLFRHALAVTKDNYIAYNNLGVYLSGQGRNDEAVENFRRALQINPTSADTLNNFGNALASLGRMDEALTSLRQSLQMNENNPEAQNNVGLILATKGQLDEAIVHFHNALHYKPDYANAHSNLGLTLATQRKFDEAIPYCLEALRLAPDSALMHNNLGCVLAEAGRLDEAMAHLREALRLKPDYAQVRFKLGCVLAQLGRRDEAIAQLREAVRLQPFYTEAQEQLHALGAQ
jgi:Tfp pilus assembly protein PilF